MIVRREADCCENCTHKLVHRSELGRMEYCELIYMEKAVIKYERIDPSTLSEAISSAYIRPTQVCDHWSKAIEPRYCI